MPTTSRDLDEGGRRWLIKIARANYWRVCSFMDVEDLIQDGYMHWMRVVSKYPQVTERPHLMRLFQRTYLNHLHNLAKKRTRDLDTLDAHSRLPSPTHPPDDEILLVLLAKAPPPIRALARNLALNPQRLRAPNRVFRDGYRETLNDKLCAIAKVDPHTDLRRQLLELLT